MADTIIYKIKGHEKFTLREGWLNKGLLCVINDNRLFLGIEGADKLGVGSNMVKAIRYYMQSFKLIDESQTTGTTLSALGQVIYDNDLYFEDIFTMWLLHSNIAKNSERSTMWYLFFNKCNAEEFKKEELFELLKKELFKFIGKDNTPDSSIKDDIDVLLNMYSKSNENDDPEDKTSCPMATLGLIKKDKDIYIKQQPDLRKVSEWVILYEVSCMFGDGASSKSIDAIAEEIGNIYHMTKVTVNSYLDRLDNMGYIRVDRTAGLDVIYPIKMMQSIDVIKEYYKQHK